MNILINLLRSFIALLLFTLIFGLAYPLFLSVTGRFFMPYQTNGSLIEKNGTVIGSALIGQDFSSDMYFHGRPAISDPSNSPTSKEMFKRIAQSAKHLEAYNLQKDKAVPVSLVTDSGSTCDPDISPEAAYFQILRVSKNTGISQPVLKSMIDKHIQNRFLNLYGSRRVNVLLLNLEIYNYIHGSIR